SVDDQVVGPTPITFELAPGPHRVTLRLAGYADQSADVVVDLRTPKDVTLRLTPAMSMTPAAPPTRPADESHAARGPASPSATERRFGPVAPWIVLGTGAASMLGAIGFELGRRSAE